MKLRESILIILSVGLLSSTVYFVLNVSKLHKENEKVKNELLAYKTSVHLNKEAEKKILEELKKKQKEKQYLEVKQKVEDAYALAHRLKNKYKHKKNQESIILEALNQSDVYVKKYTGNQVGDVNISYLVDGLRAIPLEEIQKVRRRREGYIKVKSQNTKAVQYIYVKNLEMHQLFIGASVIFR